MIDPQHNTYPAVSRAAWLAFVEVGNEDGPYGESWKREMHDWTAFVTNL